MLMRRKVILFPGADLFDLLWLRSVLLRLILRLVFPKKRKRRYSNFTPNRRRSNVNRRTLTAADHSATPPAIAPVDLPATLTGKCYVVDGDTIKIGNVSLRLAGIDAPELDHPWGKRAKWELIRICKGQEVTARLEPAISYDRVVATCFLPDGRDLSAEMVKAGMALDWPKFSGGKYAHLEGEGLRKKHWKAAARQRGQMHIFNK